MELANIEKLLEKYLDATTTVKEEQQLKEFFTTQQVPEHLEQYSVLFGYFKESKNEVYTKTIQLNPSSNKKNWKWLSVAASLALLASVFVGQQQYEQYQQRKQYAQIKEALQLVSHNLNKGNDAIYSVSNNIAKGNQAVKSLNTYEKTVHTVFNKVNY
ncbi:hypothetical protein [Tenacibaculum geojense]|uniref:Uncharacterized protein n=1 Tax=Tenacibaculum geojense TaxID=915352 RepID=A0ABW3JPB0_9FLAO